MSKLIHNLNSQEIQIKILENLDQ
ncbi:hypothetical protein DERP_012131, partial [Dermatophagoides pteronyssinus]